MTQRLSSTDAAALRAYKTFHGKPPRVVKPGAMRVPTSLILLGRAVSIVYETDKLNGGGDGRMCEYIHTFETPVGLYMDESQKVQLYLIGPKLIVTEAGIEN